jgi:hypothetical protein
MFLRRMEGEMRMIIGIPKEGLAGETRVAATPNSVKQLKKLGFDIAVESGAGEKASFPDEAYSAAGASVADSATIWQSDLIYKINPPSDAEIAMMKDGATLVSFIYPGLNPDLVKKLSGRKINVLAMDMVPRISRAQALDALSSMANIGGYRRSSKRPIISDVSSPGRSPQRAKCPRPRSWSSARESQGWPPSEPPARWEPSSGPLTPGWRWRNRSNPWAENSLN